MLPSSDKRFLVGVPRIDKHNLYLLEQLKKVYILFESEANKHKVASELGMLYEHVTYHFASEEIWMQSSKYTLISQHQKNHWQLMKKLTNIYNNHLQHDFSVTKALLFFGKSLVVHIKNDDAKYANYLSNNTQCKIVRIISHK